MIEKVTIPEGVSGPWKITRFTVTEEQAQTTALRAMVTGGRERPVSAGTYSKLTHNGAIVMSDTPAEMDDHRPFVRRARGNVLITGLGLGMVVGAVAAKPAVEHVTVIEASPDVVHLVADHYRSSRVTIHLADAFDWVPPAGAHYNAVWHDIWPDMCTANLRQMTRLKRKYGRFADWQGCWGEEHTRRHR
jgi:hypothetical protein